MNFEKILPIVKINNDDLYTIDTTIYDIGKITKIENPFKEKLEVSLIGKIIKIKAKNKKENFFKYIILEGENRKYYLLIEKKYIPEIIFTYVPKKTIPKRVSLVGTFNGWNINKDIMHFDKKKGVFTLTKRLAPGIYTYKFYVDGKWIFDSSNSLKEPDGFGGFNSICKVEGNKHKKNIYILPYKINTPFISFKIMNVKKKDIEKIYIEENNKLFLNPDYTIKNKVLTIKINSNFENLRLVRIILFFKNKTLPYIFYYQIGKGLNYDDFFDWRKAVMYFAMTDRFCNGNKKNDNPIHDPELKPLCNYMGGDFEGITKKIKEGYFKKLGIDVIWISPVLKNPDEAYRDSLPPHYKFSGYHGYWPIKPRTIESRFGGKEALKELVKTAHKNNIKILIDFVARHVHIKHPYYKNHPEWFGTLNLPDGRKNIRLFDEYPLTTWFDTFLPAFDYEKNPKAIEQITDDALWLINTFDIDGFRQDAVKHIPHIFWRSLKKKLHKLEIKKHKCLYQVGETISDYDTIKSYVNYGELDGQFDFPLCWKIRDCFAWENEPMSALISAVQESEEKYGYDSLMGIFLGNHDFARFIAYCDFLSPQLSSREKELFWENPDLKLKNPKKAYKKMKNAFGFLFSLNGIPLIYYGDEIGLYGLGDPDNRRMMKFKNLNKFEKDMFNWISKLIKIRKSHPALYIGTFTPIKSQKDLIIYRKDYFNDHIFVIINRLKTEKEILLPYKGTYIDIIDRKKYKKKILLKPYKPMYLKINE